jgi:hypothetical protein
MAANPPLEKDSGDTIEGANKPLLVDTHGLDWKVSSCNFAALISSLTHGS